MCNSNDFFDFEIIDASSLAFLHKRIIYDESGFVRDFEVLHANPAFEKLMNLKNDEIYGMEESSFFGYAQKNYQKLLKEHTTLFQQKKSFFIDIYSPRFQKWLRIKYEHIRDDYYMSLIIDINAEKIIMQTSNEIFQSGDISSATIAERAFRLSEASFIFFGHFREKEEFLSDLNCFYETKPFDKLADDMTIFFAEQTKSKLLETFLQTPQFQIQNSSLKLSIPEDHDYKIHLLNKENTLKGVFVFVIKKDNEIKNLPFLLTYMEQISMLMLRKDLLEKRLAAEKNLKQKEKDYKIMTENTTDGVAMIKKGKLKYISPSYLKMLSIMDKETLTYIEDALVNVPETYRQKIKNNFLTAEAEKAETLTNRYPVIRKDGSKIWIEDRIKISWDDDEKPDIVYINGRNVTKQVQYEDELKETKKRIEAANTVKTEFMMNMSHELRTPLNGILGFSHVLKGTELSSEQLEYLSNIETSGKRLLGIVSDILDFTKIHSHKLKVTTEPANLRKMLQNLMVMIHNQAEKKGLDTTLTIDERIPNCLLIDRLNLTQVLGNLLMNALKFTEEGEIALNVTLFTMNSQKAIVKFSVVDTGIGIDDSMKKIIFESFTQADSSITRQYGGTGLGLSISSGILDLMGSRLNLISQRKKGSEFSFILTLEICDQKNKKEQEKIIEKKIEKTYKQLKILIVEDNPINLKLNKTIIKRHYPYAKLSQAINGKEAVEKHLKDNFDLILMDIRMPEMNGLEATQIIRQNIRDRDVIVIGLSAEAQKDKINDGFSSGMDEYIIKPVIPNELIKKINKHI